MMGADQHYLKEELGVMLSQHPELFDFLQCGPLDGIWYANLEQSPDEWVSNRFWETLGHDPGSKSFVRSEWQKLVDPDDLERAERNLEQHLENPGVPFEQELRFRHADGSTIWMRCHGLALRNESGQPIRLIRAHNNITVFKRAEQALREKTASLEAMDEFQKLIMKSSPDPMFVKDANSRIIFANQAFLGLYPENMRDEVIGFTTVENYLPEEAEFFLAEDRRALELGETHSLENICMPDGQRRVFDTAKTRFVNATGEVFLLGTARDVTEREHLIKRLQRSNEDLDAFAYVASHDLKSPLNAINKLVSWIEHDAGKLLPDESRNHLELLRNRSVRMMRLLDDLLLYSRVGRVQHDTETIELERLTRSVFELLDTPEGFTLSADDARFEAPRVPLELILRNLISNAIKHHDQDSGAIVIQYRRDQEYHVITVTDDGPGIPPSLQSKAVQMFQTLKPRDQVEGSGMGLALIDKLVTQYGGTLHLNSDGVRGTTITVNWPTQTPR